MFYGRAEELHDISQTLDAVAEDRACHVLVVRGEPGIGKSALLRQVIDQSDRRRGGRFHVGYGQAMATSIESEAYTAVRESLRSLASSAPSDSGFFRHLAHGVANSAPDWLAAIPLIGDALAGGAALAVALKNDKAGDDDVTSSPSQQLVSLIDSLAERNPLLLVLDDLHWADGATLDVIVRAALTLAQRPVALLLSYRHNDASAQALRGARGRSVLEHSLVRMQRYLAGEHRFHEIALNQLDESSMRQLVAEEMRQQGIQERDVDGIMARARGNPLFASTLAQLPASSQAGPQAPNGGKDAITAVLEEQLSFLEDEHMRLLETAAAVGMAFEVDYLAALARQDEDDVYDAIDAIQRRGSIVDPYIPRGRHERYTFHHPLLCELLLRRARENAPRWRRINGRLLDVYRAEADQEGAWDDDVIVRAVGCAQVSGRRPDTHRIAAIAAARQLQLGAVAQAITLARASLDCADTPRERFAAARVLMEGLIQAADHRGCAATFEALAAEAALGGDQVLPSALLYARSLRMLARWERLAGQLEAIIGGAYGPPNAASLARALMLRAEAELCGPRQDTAACLETLRQVLASTTEDDLEARALGHRALALLAAYRPDEAATAFEGCLEAARRSGDPYVIYEAVHWESKRAIAVLALDEADRRLDQLKEISRRHGVAGQRPYHARDLSRVRGLQGRHREAAEAFRDYWRRQQASNPARAVDTLALQVAELRDLQGAQAASAFLDELGGVCPEPEVASLRQAFQEAGEGFEAEAFCLREAGIDPSELGDADAIFRFDVPDLAQLRSIDRGQ